ncbi:hypothetical protein INT45_001273 [Circinella minor]|uniref:Nucleotide exchange factor Fes1 domain-containing protein n=1 Tax=Circinella minor TaxID=1195481 RepID=A0A8H7VEP6_9FUNG|nr:hypothetical protein INT45_001273 [Circinella minor]
MEKLLQWAVNNSDQEALKKQAEAIRKGELKADPSKFDPAMIEAILGKDDATRMKEAVECIVDPKDTLENKEIALDNLELLIEGIDNANNIENMKLWPPLLSQLNAEEPEIRKGVAWVCGTAMQNNPKAQEAFLANEGLEKLVELLKNEQSKQVKATVIYAVSGLLKHSSKAQELFEQKGGFDALFAIVKPTTEPTILRKTVFLFNSLLIENKQFGTKLLEQGGLKDLCDTLAKYTEDDQDDEDMVEKVLRTCHTLITETKTSVPEEFKQYAKKAADKYGKENLNMAESEWLQLLA